MILQESKAGCGAAAICNAIEALGGHAYQGVAFAIAGGTGTRGIDERGMLEALETLGYVGEPFARRRAADAVAVLRGALVQERPTIIAVATDEPQDHWVTVIGRLGDRYVIADSADDRLVRTTTVADLVAWWRAPTGFYGIRVRATGEE
jgi:predicted double-glycine peptidase